MAQLFLYNTGQADSCGECLQWDGQIGTEDELPQAPNPDCYNGSCNCYLEEVDAPDGDCEAEGLIDCVDSEGLAFCGNEGDEGCGEEGCWCTTGADPQTGDESECESPYWDENCICSDVCPDRDDEGE